MDLTLPVTYRDTLLTGAAGGPGGNQAVEGLRLTHVTYSDVSVHGYTEKKSLSDGMDASDVYLGQRVVTLRGEAFAQTKAALYDWLDVLRLKFTPTDSYNEDPDKRGYLPLHFQQPTLYTTHYPDGIVHRTLNVRALGQPEYDLTLAAVSGPDDGFVIPFTVRLEAKDPRFYGEEQVELNISGTGGTAALTNRGNYPAPLNFILHVLAGSPATGSFVFNGYGTNMTVAIPAVAKDRTVRVDSVNKIVTYTEDAVETLRMDLISFTGGTTYPQILSTPEEEAPAQFTWTYAGGTLDALSRLFFNEAWA